MSRHSPKEIERIKRIAAKMDFVPASSEFALCKRCKHEHWKHDQYGCKTILRWERLPSGLDCPVWCQCMTFTPNEKGQP